MDYDTLLETIDGFHTVSDVSSRSTVAGVTLYDAGRAIRELLELIKNVEMCEGIAILPEK